jgi:hypothetical protein
VKWLLRFLLWATLLSLPCALVSHAYQRGLARVATVVLAAAGQGVEIDEVQVMAPFDLAIFTAMCLASLAAPWPMRRRALAIGLPVLVALEVLTVTGGIAFSAFWPHSSSQLDASLRLTGLVMETVPWVGGVTVWLLLLGAWELRVLPESGRPSVRPKARPARPG